MRQATDALAMAGARCRRLCDCCNTGVDICLSASICAERVSILFARDAPRNRCSGKRAGTTALGTDAVRVVPDRFRSQSWAVCVRWPRMFAVAGFSRCCPGDVLSDNRSVCHCCARNAVVAHTITSRVTTVGRVGCRGPCRVSFTKKTAMAEWSRANVCVLSTLRRRGGFLSREPGVLLNQEPLSVRVA